MENKVREIMKKRGIKSTELAYKSGVSERYINFIAKGDRSPSLKVAMRMAKILHCKVGDIFSL